MEKSDAPGLAEVLEILKGYMASVRKHARESGDLPLLFFHVFSFMSSYFS